MVTWNLFVQQKRENITSHDTVVLALIDPILSEHLVSVVLHHSGGQVLSMEVSTGLLAC